MKQFFSKYVISAIAAILMVSLHAQENRVDLTALYNMRIGATCDELAANYKKLLEKADSPPSTECFPDTGFSRDEIKFKSTGKNELVTLKYTPEGKLWSIWSDVRFTDDLGPTEDVTIKTLIKRFGTPKMYADYSQDNITRNNLKKNGYSKTMWKAGWSSEKTVWAGNINTHASLAPCEPVIGAVPKVKCVSDLITQSSRSWQTHLEGLKGIVTTVLLITETTVNGSRVVLLRTIMYDPKFVARSDAFYKKRMELMGEQLDLRDVERLPKF